jgi:hypothetical protein
MAKTKKAENQFAPGVDYLAKILDVRWAALPAVGEDAGTTMIRIKISVVCTHDSKRDPQFLGLEAVVYVAIDRDGNPGKEGWNFLREIGIKSPVKPSNDVEIARTKQWIACQFSKADPVHNYQSIISWGSVDEGNIQTIVGRVFESNARKSPAFGLKFPGGTIIKRNGKEVDLKSNVQINILNVLAHQNSSINKEQLSRQSWARANKSVPTGADDALYSAISKLNDRLHQLDLHIPRATSSGYRLEVRTRKSD